MSEAERATAREYLVQRFADSRDSARQLYRWFLRNASAKHGVPLDESPPSIDLTSVLARSSEPVKHEHVVNVTGLTQPSPAPATRPPEARQESTAAPPWYKSAFPYVLAAAATGSGLVGYGLANWSKDDTPTTVEIHEADGEQSPLQWLEDQGAHRP